MYFWLVKYQNEIHENKSLPYLNPRPTHTPDPFSRFDGLHFVLIVLVSTSLKDWDPVSFRTIFGTLEIGQNAYFKYGYQKKQKECQNSNALFVISTSSLVENREV